MKSNPATKQTSLSFADISYDAIPFLIRRFREFGSRSCDYSLGGVLIWTDMFDYKWANIDDVLFFRGVDPASGRLLYYLPVGQIDRNYALDLMRQDAMGRDACLVDYTEDFLDGNPDFPIHSAIGEPYPDWDEYVYDIDQFIGFKGRKMEKKRNHLNYFLREYSDCRILDILTQPVEELREFSHKLDAFHTGESSFLYENEEAVNMLSRLADSRMFGIVLRLDDDIIGYAYGEVIGDTFFAHVEKGDAAYRGVYQMLSSEMAKCASLRGARFVNREDDMGSLDLRKSKLSYHPVMMIRKRLLPL